jgi:hypothetical protein
MPKPETLLRASLTILCALALTSCGDPRVRLSPLPAELTECADEPSAPDLPAREGKQGLELDLVQKTRDQMMLDYVLNWRTAWGDCKAKVNGAKAWNQRVGG